MLIPKPTNGHTPEQNKYFTKSKHTSFIGSTAEGKERMKPHTVPDMMHTFLREVKCSQQTTLSKKLCDLVPKFPT
jgi:hypothetical protein